jgi:ribonuclease HI
MRSSNPNAQTRRELAQRLNRVVDRVLQNADESALVALLEVAAGEETMALCSRISRRATRLARHDPAQGPAIIAARNRRVLEIHGHRAPKDWFSAWCDGSSAGDARRKRSGIGVVLMDAQRRVGAELGESAGALSPLAAELAALEAAVRTAAAHGAARLRVYTDCPALIHLWYGRRDDDRLAGVAQAAQPLRRLQLYLVPRRFNQLADSLARRACAGTSTRG